eukprot:1097998-Pyramimonas_sp.AAC.1
MQWGGAGGGRLHVEGGRTCSLACMLAEPRHRPGLDVEDMVGHTATSDELFLRVKAGPLAC